MAKPFGILKEEHLGKACILHPGVHHLPSVYIMNVHFVTQCPIQNRRHLITTILSSMHHFFPEHTNMCTYNALAEVSQLTHLLPCIQLRCQMSENLLMKHHYLQFTPKKNNACTFAKNTFTSDSLSSEPPQEISTEFTPIQTLECMCLKSVGFLIIHCIRNKSFTSNKLSDG